MPERVLQWRATMTFSSTVIFWKSRMFWKVRARPCSVTLLGLRRLSRVDSPPGGWAIMSPAVGS